MVQCFTSTKGISGRPGRPSRDTQFSTRPGQSGKPTASGGKIPGTFCWENHGVFNRSSVLRDGANVLLPPGTVVQNHIFQPQQGQDGQANSAAAGNVPAPDASASTAMDNMTSPTLDAGKGLLSLHHGIDDGLPAIQYELSPQHSMQGRVPGLPDTHR